MHLGNVFCALIAWLDARAQGERMLLRIEDLDPDRCRHAYAMTLMEDLRYLGLDWDEGGEDETYFQSTRRDIYEQALQMLEKKGLVYPCFCTRAQLHAASAPHASDGQTLYAGTCAHIPTQEAAQRIQTERFSLRVRVPAEEIAFVDRHYGAYRENLAQSCGDFVVRRSDGVHAYQLAVVVDDALMGVTDVVRGRDLLPSTPRQIWLYRQLGYEPPRFMHIPLLCAPDGRRLSKRDGDLDMGALRSAGVRAEQIVGFLLHKAGMLAQNEPISAREAIAIYDAQKLPREDIPIAPEDVRGLYRG